MEELPCLAFHKCGRATTLFSASEKKPIAAGGGNDAMGELLADKVVCPTARGILLVHDSSAAATFLFNPRTGDKIHLPLLQGIEDKVLMNSHCLLSDDPTASGCVLLLVDPDLAVIRYVRPAGGDADNQWVKYDYDIGTQPADFNDDSVYEKKVICPIAACGGKFYFNGSSTELGVLEFCPDPVFSSIGIDDTIPIDTGYSCGHCCEPGSIRLVESGGELYMVSMFFKSIRDQQPYRAVVHKLDLAERRWRRVDDLGGRVFLVSLFYFGASCFPSGGETGLEEDCVYIVYPVKKALQVFNVKQGTNQMLNLDEAPSSSDKAFWVLPITTSA